MEESPQDKDSLSWYERVLKEQKYVWSLKMPTREYAYKSIMDFAWALIAIGTFLIVLSFFMAPYIPEGEVGFVLDGFFLIGLGALLGYKKQVWVAWIITLLFAVSVPIALYNEITQAVGGRNFLLAAIFLFFAIKAVYATRSLKGGVVAPTTRFQRVGERVFPYMFWVLFVLLVTLIVLGLVL